MSTSDERFDTGAPEQRTGQRILKSSEHSASDFDVVGDAGPFSHAMWCTDMVNPDLDVGAALDRLDAIDEGRAESNPLRAAVDALGGSNGR